MTTKKLITTAAALITLFLLSAPAMAARDLGEIAQGLGEQGSLVGSAIVIIAAVAGLLLIVIGFLQIKKASRQGGGYAGGGWIAVIIGVLLCCLVVFSGSVSKTIFGEDDAMSSHVEDFQ